MNQKTHIMRNTINLSIQKKQVFIHVFSFLILFICAIQTSYAQENKSLKNTKQQTFTIKGTVLSKMDNEPLPGTNIKLKNSTRGVQTDINGNFEITNVKEGDVISFSFLGFEKQDFVVHQNNPFIKVNLNESSFQLLGAVDTKNTYKTKRSFWKRVTSIF